MKGLHKLHLESQMLAIIIGWFQIKWTVFSPFQSLGHLVSGSFNAQPLEKKPNFKTLEFSTPRKITIKFCQNAIQKQDSPFHYKPGRLKTKVKVQKENPLWICV